MISKENLEKTINWRWEQLEKDFSHCKEPMGLCENIDDAIFGELNWEQRSLIKQPNFKWIKKEKTN